MNSFIVVMACASAQGRTVAFFRLPAQRLISAFWHALHADGMAESSHKDMHAAIYGLKRKISRWRVRVANISLSTLQRQIPPEILPEYREAMSIYFHWPGVQVSELNYSNHNHLSCL